jgi:signal peptidase I
MFGFFSSPDSKMRHAARGWLELASKVRHYRRDQLTRAELDDLHEKTATLRAQVRDKAGHENLKLSIEALEPVLRRTGGKHYPRSGVAELVEFLVVAIIVLLALRQFFFQPFQIPTNSMWPSYNGMIPEIHPAPADEPGASARALRYVALGASAHRVDSPADGEILIPTGILDNRAPATGRHWLVFPQPQYEYALYVGGPKGVTKVSVKVPRDFDFGLVLRDTFAPQCASLDEAIRSLKSKNGFLEMTGADEWGRPISMPFIRTGKRVRAGERVLSFDIISGDRLFVDRMSYHFVRPSIGDGFVFHTTNIPGTMDSNGNHIESYYIKRLVGLPGDTLQIRPPALHRNGAPITGAQAFADNAARAGKYRGYTNVGLLDAGKTRTISEDGYFALGDNSSNSADSRYFGEVPKKDAVGRPLWVFYPFGSHWGPAR